MNQSNILKMNPVTQIEGTCYVLVQANIYGLNAPNERFLVVGNSNHDFVFEPKLANLNEKNEYRLNKK